VNMPSSFYEIIELPNGDVVLQGTEDADAPLVSIRFSAESLAYLGESRFEVAKAMIEAGMDAASELAEDRHEEFDRDEFGDGSIETEKLMLH